MAALNVAGITWRCAYTSICLSGTQAEARIGLRVAVLPREMCLPSLTALDESLLPPLADTEIALIEAPHLSPTARRSGTWPRRSNVAHEGPVFWQCRRRILRRINVLIDSNRVRDQAVRIRPVAVAYPAFANVRFPPKTDIRRYCQEATHYGNLRSRNNGGGGT